MDAALILSIAEISLKVRKARDAGSGLQLSHEEVLTLVQLLQILASDVKKSSYRVDL